MFEVCYSSHSFLAIYLKVAQLAVLIHNPSGRRLVFATTHLKADKTPEGEETRQMQARQLLNEVLLHVSISSYSKPPKSKSLITRMALQVESLRLFQAMAMGL